MSFPHIFISRVATKEHLIKIIFHQLKEWCRNQQFSGRKDRNTVDSFDFNDEVHEKYFSDFFQLLMFQLKT